MSAGKRFAEALEDARQRKQFVERFGPPEEWVIPAEEIEDVLTRGICRHGVQDIGDCRECVTRECIRRQFRLLAERMGCDRATAVQYADRIVAEQDAKGSIA